MGRALPLLCLSAALGCAPGEVAGDIALSAASPVHPTLHTIRWALDWDLDGVEWTPDGISITNDLGVTFVVAGGVLLDDSLVAVPCADTVADVGWERWLGVGSAHADHSAFADPSSFEEHQIEPLAAPAARTLGDRSFDPTSYCTVHWLVARADEGTESDGVDLSGVALSLQARWSGPDGEGALSFETEWTNGALLDLTIEEARQSGEAVAAEITVVRSLGGLFDGVDPATQSELAIAWSVLENLMAGSRLRVEVLDAL